MRPHRALVFGFALASLLTTGAALAQPVPPPPPPPWEPVREPAPRDGVRLRGGFSLNGGVLFAPGSDGAIGPAISLSARLGVQVNHLFSVYYQQTPMLHFIHGPNGYAAGFNDYNTVLANFTLGHMFEIGAGPSLDYLAIGVVTNDLGVGSASTLAPGAHARLALLIGGLSGNGPRRSGFAIGVDVHPSFAFDTVLLAATAGVGADWY
jgi:hypothetical protein